MNSVICSTRHIIDAAQRWKIRKFSKWLLRSFITHIILTLNGGTKVWITYYNLYLKSDIWFELTWVHKVLEVFRNANNRSADETGSLNGKRPVSVLEQGTYTLLSQLQLWSYWCVCRVLLKKKDFRLFHKRFWYIHIKVIMAEKCRVNMGDKQQKIIKYFF